MKIKKILSGLLVIMLFIGITASQNITVQAKASVGITKIKVVDNLKGTTLKVTWKKVSKASGYSVYMSTSKDGIYEKVKSTKKTSYVTKELESNVTYYFKVVAYKTVKKERVYGNYSNIAKCKTSTFPLYTVIDKGGEDVYFYTLWDSEPNVFGYIDNKSHEDCMDKCLSIIKSRYPDRQNRGYHTEIYLYQDYKINGIVYKDYRVNGKLIAKVTPGYKWK